MNRLVNWIRGKIRKLFHRDYRTFCGIDFGENETCFLVVKHWDNGTIEVIKEEWLVTKKVAWESLVKTIDKFCKKYSIPRKNVRIGG